VPRKHQILLLGSYCGSGSEGSTTYSENMLEAAFSGTGQADGSGVAHRSQKAGARGLSTAKVLHQERIRRMAPAAADRPHFPEMAARAFQDDSGRREPQVRPRRPAANRLQLAAYMHLSAPDGRGRLLPDREKLPHQCRDDRKVLRGTYQDGARCRRDQHHETETEKETKPTEKLKINQDVIRAKPCKFRLRAL
jgi:hypothetical protein